MVTTNTLAGRAADLVPRCAEVRGGSSPVHARIELPGLRGVIWSLACGDRIGGDVHFVSVCGSGLVGRICLADVLGHGAAVGRTAQRLHAAMQRTASRLEHRAILGMLNQAMLRLGGSAMTTAALLTFNPITGTATTSHAGHPPGWILSGARARWDRLATIDLRPPGRRRRRRRGPLRDVPLALVPDARFSRRRFRVRPGDRILLVTDGILEAPDAQRRFFGSEGVERVLEAQGTAPIDALADALRAAVIAHGGGEEPIHDDVTFILLEVVPGPRRPWLVALRNRSTALRQGLARLLRRR